MKLLQFHVEVVEILYKDEYECSFVQEEGMIYIGRALTQIDKN